MSEVGGVFRTDNGEVEFALFTEVLRTFDEAETFCEDLGRDSSLARISNLDEFTAGSEKLSSNLEQSRRIWIGKVLELVLSDQSTYPLYF